jgi:DNA helicase-2/ATP-dependent DNA helicase PcrA
MTQDFYDSLWSLLSAESVSDAIQAISDSFKGLQKDYTRANDDIFFLDPPFALLSEFAEEYDDDFCRFEEDIQNAIDTLANVSTDDDTEFIEGEDAQVHLMTALRAKGREFDTVIILDANDGIWPIDRATQKNELEQERRLFYVAFTRTREKLFCIVNDTILGRQALPSPYLYEAELL